MGPGPQGMLRLGPPAFLPEIGAAGYLAGECEFGEHQSGAEIHLGCVQTSINGNLYASFPV